jgi:uncharacterized membrane protein
MGLTNLGIVHTLVSIVALACGLAALLKYHQIPHGSTLGKVYFWTTFVTAATGLGIFQHGGFGPPHVLSILTIIALAVAWAAAGNLFGGASRYLVVAAYTTTVLFHLIPGFTETLTRLPPGSPVAASQDAPILVGIDSVLFVVYLIVLGLQLRKVHAAK